MVAACPFPVNYGSPAAIRELSQTLSEMGHEVHVVTYPEGDDLPVGTARVHRVGHARKASDFRQAPRATNFGPMYCFCSSFAG